MIIILCFDRILQINYLDCRNVITAFHEACSLESADVVQIFLENNRDDLITEEVNGLNALQIATMNQRNNVVQILLRRYKLYSSTACKSDCHNMVVRTVVKCNDSHYVHFATVLM